MSLYQSLIAFAIDPDTGEGWDAAVSKAETWRDALQEMQEIGSPSERANIQNLLGSLEFFFMEYRKHDNYNA